MARTLPDLAIVLTFIRSGQGRSQGDLGRVVGISANAINDLERGQRELKRWRLEQLVSAMGLPSATIDATLNRLLANRAAARAPHDASDPFAETILAIEDIASQASTLTADFTRSLLSMVTFKGEALKARQQAAASWARLKPLTSEQRRVLVEGGKEFRTWALCEKAAIESIDAAANQPEEALALAGLALRIAELAPGSAAFRLRLQGFAHLFVSNAQRACNQLPRADESMTRARKLWQAGTDPGLLNPAWLPWIESVLHRDHRRFIEALACSDEALALDQGELRSKILLSKANLLDAMGDSLASTAVLMEASPLIDSTREPRLAFGLRFNLVSDLCHVGRLEEASEMVHEVREMAERGGEELDLVRVVWLEGKIAAGQGRPEVARGAFEQVRRQFLARKLGFDYALASLDLSLLLQSQRRPREVAALATEMLWIFREQGVAREALAALKIFLDAVQRDAATVDLTRRVVDFLRRAQHDPGLHFETEAL